MDAKFKFYEDFLSKLERVNPDRTFYIIDLDDVTNGKSILYGKVPFYGMKLPKGYIFVSAVEFGYMPKDKENIMYVCTEDNKILFEYRRTSIPSMFEKLKQDNPNVNLTLEMPEYQWNFIPEIKGDLPASELKSNGVEELYLSEYEDIVIMNPNKTEFAFYR